jgi:AcrR family transcriptional regulator
VRRMFPGERERVLESRWRVAVSTLTQMLGNIDTQGAPGTREGERRVSQAYVDMLVEFVASGFAALMTPKRATKARKPGRAAAKAKTGPPPKPVPAFDEAGDGPRKAESASREALMDAAEDLFAALGVEGVSIRSINAAAGLSPPAVHYHFGSKEELVYAVLRRRGEVVTQRLGALLDALEARGRTPTAHELFTAIAGSYLDLIEREPVRGLRWLRLLGRLWLAQDSRLASLDAETGGLHERLMGLLGRAFPGVPEPLLEKRFRLAASTLLQMLGNSATRVAADGDAQGYRAVKAYVDVLVDFVASGFDAVMAQRRSRGGRKPVHR